MVAICFLNPDWHDPALLFVLVKGLQVQFIERLAREHAPITIGYSTSRQPCRNFAVRARVAGLDGPAAALSPFVPQRGRLLPWVWEAWEQVLDRNKHCCRPNQ